MEQKNKFNSVHHTKIITYSHLKDIIVLYLKTQNQRKCFICDSRSPYNLHHNPNSHHVENIITTFQPERKMSWWQSENGAFLKLPSLHELNLSKILLVSRIYTSFCFI